MKKLDIPYHGQERTYTCGPASLKMVFAYFDALHKESQLARQAKTTARRGTSRRRLVSVARHAGYWTYDQTNATLGVLKWFVNHELPVIINYIEPTEDAGHYTVVTGYDAKGLILHDPWNGQGFHLARRTFLSRWRGLTEKPERWLMAVGYSDFRPLPHSEGEDLLTGHFYDPLS